MLKNRLALVTGAASGIGESISKLFAREGATLTLLDINKPHVDHVKKELNLISELNHTSYMCDVSNSDQVRHVFACIKSEYAEQVPTIVVNSAGVYLNSSIERVSEKDFDSLLNVNLKGTFLVSQEAIRELKEHSGKALNPFFNASIINISSISGGRLGVECESVYSASKASIIGLTKSISREVGPFNIRCNCVLPGLIRTKMLLANDRREFVNRISKMISLRKLGDPDDVANVCLFLASNLSSYVTGACIDCNGGLSF